VLFDYWRRLQQRPGFAGISEFRLPIVTRATRRIREHKRTHPGYASAITSGGIPA
jgi:hypothetical protein